MTLIKSNGNGESVISVKPSLIKWGIPITFVITLAIGAFGWMKASGRKEATTEIAIEQIYDHEKRLGILEGSTGEVKVYRERVDQHETELNQVNTDIREIRRDVNTIMQGIEGISRDIEWIKQNSKGE